MTQMGIDWLRESSSTYENVTLSAHMMNLAFQNGIGFHTEAQEIKAKHIELLKEYTGFEATHSHQTTFCCFPDCNAECNAQVSLWVHHLGT